MRPIIEIEGLGKSYRIGANREKYLSLRDEMAQKAHGFYHRFVARHHQVPRDEEFWALKDVSFTVNEGEAVGIIGRNGAGKTTLLKILSKITPPTTGKITLRGRIASLLEVGTGFHPELSGRENIYLNGAILGMRRAEIKRKFDEIVAFAEVEQFLDTPVKRYSLGMYVRLAFAVAAHLEPEILVVDEVLAVGDAQFQGKCLGKMGEVAKGGRTVLFVSHNMVAVEALCSRAVLLRQGGVQQVGETKAVIQQYLAAGASLASVPVSDRNDREGDGSIRFTSLDIYGPGEANQAIIATGSEVNFRLNYEVNRPVMQPVFLLSIFNSLGVQLVHTNTNMAGYPVRLAAERGSLECKIPRLPLPPGRYRVNVAVRGENGCADRIECAALFEVMEGRFFNSSDTSWYGWGGCLVDHVWGPGSLAARGAELPVHPNVAASL
jgi:lipopolysaccharide transport system ATP-binding protein